MNEDNTANNKDEQMLPEGHAIDSELPEHGTLASNEMHSQTPQVILPSISSEGDSTSTVEPPNNFQPPLTAASLQADRVPNTVVTSEEVTVVADQSPASANLPVSNPSSTTSTSYEVLPTHGGLSATTEPKKSRKKLIIALFIVAVVLLLGGAGAGAMYYVFPKVAQSKIDNGMASLVSTNDTGSFTGNYRAELSVSGKDIPGGKFSAALTSQVEDSGKSYSRLSATFMAWKPQIDFMTLDNQLYIKFDGLSEARKLGETYSKSKNQDDKDAAEILGISSMFSKYDKQWLSMDLKELNSSSDSANSEELLSQDARRQIADIYKQHAFIDFKKRLKSEKINGKKAQHIRVAVNETKLKAFTSALKEANIKNLELTDNDLRQVDEFVRKYDLVNYPIDIWLGPKSRLVQIAYDHSYKSAAISFKLTEQGTGTFKIEKPAKSQPLNQLLEGAFGNFYGGSIEDQEAVGDSSVPDYLSVSKNARDTERKADIRTIQAKLAEHYAINGSYPGNLTVLGLTTESCRAPGTPDTCAKPSYSYRPLTTNNKTCTTNSCAEYEIVYYGMESVSNPFKVSSQY